MDEASSSNCLDTLPELPTQRSSFTYLTDSALYLREKPYYYSGLLDPQQEHLRTNLLYQIKNGISVSDLRGYEDRLSLDQNGFEFHRVGRLAEIDLAPREHHNVEEYLEEAVHWLEEILAAKLVVCYDYRFRRSGVRNSTGSVTAQQSGSNPDQPAETPHIDQTKYGALRRISRHLTPDEAANYLNNPQWRVRIVNIWRPLFRVEDYPLALCDYRTVRCSDIVAVDRISDQYHAEVNYLKHGLGQKWYWLSGQLPEEATLFLSFDTGAGGGAGFCPHASFKIPAASMGTPARESIEARFIVVSSTNQMH